MVYTLALLACQQAAEGNDSQKCRYPGEVRAVLYQAEALYNLCNFEYSLLGYHRATRLAPDSEAAQGRIL